MKIALIEDDKFTQKYVKDLLVNQGYLVDTFFEGEAALEAMKKEIYPLVITDINLPGMTGYDICFFIKRNIVEYGDPRILMLSERRIQDDVNKGFQFGADDYIKKPFDETEFIMRVNSLLKRKSDIRIAKARYKDLTIDFEQSFVIENSAKIDLSMKEKELLHYLILNKGLIVSKEKLYIEVWNEEYEQGNKTIEVYILKLKRKIETLKDNIQNYRNLGYRLED